MAEAEADPHEDPGREATGDEEMQDVVGLVLLNNGLCNNRLRSLNHHYIGLLLLLLLRCCGVCQKNVQELPPHAGMMNGPFGNYHMQCLCRHLEDDAGRKKRRVSKAFPNTDSSTEGLIKATACNEPL